MALFGNDEKKIENFAKIHPGGYCNISVACNGNEDEAKMLFMAYHTGKNLEKIEKFANLNGLNNTPIKECLGTGTGAGAGTGAECLLFSEMHEIFNEVINKYWIHGIIFKIYAGIISILMVFLLVYNIFYCSLCNTLLLAFVWTSYPFVVFHTRHHGGNNLFVKNKALSLYFDVFENIVNIPAKQWLLNHHLSHHMHPNTDIDYDISTPYPYLRLMKRQKFKYFHKYQWIYCIVLFMFNVMCMPFKNITDINNKKNQIKATDGHPIFFIIYLLIFIILPYHFHGLYAIKLYVFANCITSFFFTLTFQVPHHILDINHKNNHIQNVKNYDSWIKSQIEQSMSWGGYIDTLLFGGVNFQIEHHIAPAVLPIYYYFAHPKIKLFCKKHKIKYNYSNNIFSAFYQYEKYIFNLNSTCT